MEKYLILKFFSGLYRYSLTCLTSWPFVFLFVVLFIVYIFKKDIHLIFQSITQIKINDFIITLSGKKIPDEAKI